MGWGCLEEFFATKVFRASGRTSASRAWLLVRVGAQVHPFVVVGRMRNSVGMRLDRLDRLATV